MMTIIKDIIRYLFNIAPKHDGDIKEKFSCARLEFLGLICNWPSPDLRITASEFKCWLCHLPAKWLSVSHWTSPSLNFLLCEMKGSLIYKTRWSIRFLLNSMTLFFCCKSQYWVWRVTWYYLIFYLKLWVWWMPTFLSMAIIAFCSEHSKYTLEIIQEKLCRKNCP